MPGQKGRRGDGEDVGPAGVGYEAGEGSEPGPVGRFVAHAGDLAAHYRVLLPQHEHVRQERLIAARDRPEHGEQLTTEPIRQTEHLASQPVNYRLRTGAGRSPFVNPSTTGPAWSVSLRRHDGMDHPGQNTAHHSGLRRTDPDLRELGGCGRSVVGFSPGALRPLDPRDSLQDGGGARLSGHARKSLGGVWIDQMSGASR